MLTCIDCGRNKKSQHGLRCGPCGAVLPTHVVPRGAELRPSAVRIMTAEQAAWMGALIEGEGSIVLSTEKRASTPYQRPTLSVVNTSAEIISACLRFTGVGTVVGRQAYPHYKWAWFWKVSATHDLLTLLPQVIPALGDKKLKAFAAIEILTRRL